jgi:hypothetical protein
MRFWDTVGFGIEVFVMGAFGFWLFGYFAVEAVRYLVNGPSEQLKTVGTSILDEPALRTAEVLPLQTRPPEEPPRPKVA